MFHSIYNVYETVNSTSTPGCMREVISDTTESGECKSTNLLCTLIWYLCHELVPSPQVVFLVVIFKTLVGRRTGPLALNALFLASFTKSLDAFSKATWLVDERVILIL